MRPTAAHRFPWILAVLAMLPPACTSDGLGPDIGEVLDRFDHDVALVETAFLVTPSKLELSVLHGGCDRLVPRLRETGERVEIAVQNPVPAGTDCTDDGLSTTIELELAAPLGDRRLVAEVPPFYLDHVEGPPATCFHTPDDHWCREVTIRSGGEERTVGGPGHPPTPTGVTVPEGTTSLRLSAGTTVEITTGSPLGHPHLVDQPYLMEHRSLWRPDLDMWGSLVVHNVDRPLTGAPPLDRDVAGFPAYWVTQPYGADEPPDTVTVLAGPWSVDISLWTGDPMRPHPRPPELDAFLDGLTIEQRPDHFPEVTDSNGWAGPSAELTISDGADRGFTLSIAPNCPPEDSSCRPDLGFVSPPSPVVLQVAGVVDLHRPPDLDEPARPPEVEAELVAGFELVVTDFGQGRELVACSGVPAFDPALLPRGLTRHEARSAVEVYTGIRGVDTWQWRALPGVETAHVGAPDAPDVVATYERVDGTWNVTSVTSCQ